MVSLLLAAATGMRLETIVSSFETGTGNTLGHIAIVVGLGTMLGKMMAESGASDRIAETIIHLFSGEKHVPWSMMCAALIVGLPVFFEVGFCSAHPNCVYRCPAHGEISGDDRPANAGWAFRGPLHGAAASRGYAGGHHLPRRRRTNDLIRPAGWRSRRRDLRDPIYGRFIAPRIHLDPHNPMAEEFAEHQTDRGLPGFGISLATILLPVLLMMTGSWADQLAKPGTAVNRTLHLLGSADIALLVAVLVSFITLGKMRGFSRETILKFCNECLAPTANITLVIGAGGGFGRILQDSGVAQAIVAVALHAHVSLLLLGWLIAALIRLATGSSTVALTTAAGILAPILLHSPGVRPELLAIATGAGSTIFSHVNDGGFWLVKQYFNMSVADTMKTWSITETLISIIGLLLAMGLSVVM